MRIRIAAASLLALAACGSAADENFRNGVRTSGIEACADNTREEMTKAGTWSADKMAEVRELCTCLVERTIENASTGELVSRAARDERTPAERAEETRIFAECSKELARGATAGPDSSLDAATRSPAEVEPAPGEAADAGPPPAERARPRAELASYASPDDYPASALRDGEQGGVAFDLDVGADGRVSRCLVTASSGSSALDQATCRIMRSRARFTPARDAQGHAVPDRVRGELSWTLPAG